MGKVMPSLPMKGMRHRRRNNTGGQVAQVVEVASASAIAPLVALRFVDNRGKPTEIYPLNPSGSPQGIAGVTTPDGRFTILMPHPERGFRAAQHSWHPGWQEDAPWMRMFSNARRWIG